MSFYISKILNVPFETAIEKVTAALKEEGFGILTDIDVSATLKSKIGVEWRPYRILGACNPKLAHSALQAEDKIGVMLPCNVIVQVRDGGEVEIAAIDPSASMSAAGNADLTQLAATVRAKLSAALDRLTG